MTPLLLLVFSIIFVAVAIVKFRVHAFLSLISAAVLVGLFSTADLTEPARQFDLAVGDTAHASLAIELALREFGKMVAAVGLVIVLASIIGSCLLESGAADRITRTNLRVLGEQRAPLALMFSAFVLSIPVFLDTVFFMLVPIAKAFRLRTGKNYVLYVMSICGGAVLTHSLVAPTPGPLLMAETLRLDLTTTIVAGLVFSVLPALAGLGFASFVNARLDIPVRETAEGASIEELQQIVRRGDDQVPNLVWALTPILVPIAMISCGTIASSINASYPLSPAVFQATDFIGNKNIALAVGALVAVVVCLRQSTSNAAKVIRLIESAVTSAAVVILITGAGGAFGAMIRHAGVGDAIAGEIPDLGSGMVLVLLAFFLAMLIKIAQGSGTVSMITTSAILFGLIEGQSLDALPVHPIYLFLAIGFGSMPISWMNDSGFWIVGRMSGFTERETLQTWTALLLVIAIVGLTQILIVSAFLPLKGLSW